MRWILAATVLLAALLGGFIGRQLAQENLDALELPDSVDLLSQEHLAARSAYERLFGDGLGLEGGEPMTWEIFQERYMAAALRERLSRAFGKADLPNALPSGFVEEVRKKDAPTTLDGQVEALLAQKRQFLAVKEMLLEGKEEQSLTAGPVPCGSPLYDEHVYSQVDGCSASDTKSPSCGRWMLQEVANEEEVAAMKETVLQAFKHLFHAGPMTSLAVDSKAWPLLSAKMLTQDLLQRSRQAISGALGIELFFSGALLVRLQIPPIEGDMQQNSSLGDAFAAHVDKANVASYDWSALLYLSSAGIDFEGGELLFLNTQKDSVLAPVAGQLAFFSSGLENVHRVKPMVRGCRLVLAMWFTCSQRHSHPDLEIHAGHLRET